MTLLGAGATKKPDLNRALRVSERLVCADSGADTALKWGYKPDLVIGDLDSVDRDRLRREGIPEIQVLDQETTDFEKCLGLLEAKTIIAVGFTGKRLDHQLAAFNALVKYPRKQVLLIGDVDLCFVCPTTLALDLPVGERVSIFPMADCRCKSRGLEWPLAGLDMQPNGQIGTSNRVCQPNVRITVQAGHPICILPKRNLKRVMAALTGGQVNG
ncbi:MAG: thiamine diphosphokinase [Rhodobacteraceae bacterium]|nr:thiamine diphosphokinase [Paracoccaceae bacterium]